MLLTTPFLRGTPSLRLNRRPTPDAHPAPQPPATLTVVIKAMRSLQGRVVCSTNDKTVAVEVTRLAPHPKYKRRVRKKKTYQAHDELNQFEVGDVVQLEKCRPISKSKTFRAVPAPERAGPKIKGEASQEKELGIPLESQSA